MHHVESSKKLSHENIHALIPFFGRDESLKLLFHRCFQIWEKEKVSKVGWGMIKVLFLTKNSGTRIHDAFEVIFSVLVLLDASFGIIGLWFHCHKLIRHYSQWLNIPSLSPDANTRSQLIRKETRFCGSNFQICFSSTCFRNFFSIYDKYKSCD